MGRTSSKKDPVSTSEVRNEPFPNFQDNSLINLQYDRKRSRSTIYPNSSYDSGSKNAFRNQMQPPKLVSTNGRSWSGSSRSKSEVLAKHRVFPPTHTNGVSRCPPTISINKSVHSSLNDLETEFHRVLSEPVTKTPLRRPDVILIKSKSVGTNPQSAEPLTPLSPLESKSTTSHDTLYIYDTRDDIHRLLPHNSGHSDYECRDDQSVEIQLLSYTTNEQIKIPKCNRYSDWLNDFMHSDSVLIEIQRAENTVNNIYKVEADERSFSSFFCKKKKRHLKKWPTSIHRQIGSFGRRESNKGVHILRSTGILT